MDITTIVGLIAGFTLIIMGIYNGGELASFIDTGSLLITVGGTFAATLIAYPLSQVVGILGIVKKAFFHTSIPPTELIEKIVAKLDEAGGLYICVLADPTTGGVTASFAMLAKT